ncbi:MAG: DUF3039 domain-containing protein [Kineosporiaceae bacterium]
MTAAPPGPPTGPRTDERPAPGGTAVLEREAEVAPAEPGDHERFAHYVDKNKIVESAVTGTPVTALCGKVWVPNRDPSRFPVCPVCQEIYEGLRPGDEGDDGSGDAGGGSDGP